MKSENQGILLREAEIEPTNAVLKENLGEAVFEVYKELVEGITAKFELQYEWRFYNDGKSWLLKATHKKKTIFWLSIWEQFIKTSFYFTEKTRSRIADLPIKQGIKTNFNKAKPIGRLIPLVLDIEKKEELNDFLEIVKFKKSTK